MNAPIRTGVLAVVGNPRRASRTARVANAVADRITRHLRTGPAHVIDLVDAESPLGDDAAQRLAPELDRVGRAAVVVVASPTYKATYTGLLKAFADLIPPLGLQGAVAIPVMTLGGADHALAADIHLRPLLQELGASLPTPALVLTDAKLRDLDAEVDLWWDDAAPALSGIGSIAQLAG